MQISLTVKTLDSHNHVFNDVDDGSTVKDFKERIASAVGIEANLQRLIYRGRVLNDEKKLSDYSVDGKVVHLVQRPPPTGGPDRLAASEAQARSRGAAPGIARHQIHFHHRRGASSGGALPFGAEGHPSALVRLNIARSMIGRANGIIDILSNGNHHARSDSSCPPDLRQPPASDNAASQPPGSDSDQNSSAGFAFLAPGIPVSQGMTMTFSGAHGAGRFPPGLARAIQTAVNSAIGSTNGNSGQPVAMSFALGPNGQVVPISTSTGGVERQPQNPSGQPPSGNRDASARRAPSGTTVNHPPPRVLAEVMNLYGQAQERLSPYWNRLNQFLTDDPMLEGDAVVQEHQRLFDRVTEAMHFLSHAQHAISDTMLNTNSATPRQLRARPFIIQSLVQSAAVVQQMPVNLVRSSRSANSTQANTPPATTQSEEAAAEPMDTEASAADVDNGVSGANVEVTVEPIVVGIEMGPEVTIDYNPATGRVDSSAPGTPTSAILEDVLNNIVGSMMPGSEPSTSSSVASSSPSSTVTSSQQQQQPSATATQDSRARGNTQTQPTTSTRTRLSTQVLTAPMAVGPSPLGAFGNAGQSGNNFDMILPCNSHHIPGNFPTPRQIFRRAAYDRQRSASVPPPNRRGGSAAAAASPARSQRGPGTGFRSVGGESPVRQMADVINARCRLSRGENGSVSVNIERVVPSSSVANAGQPRPRQASGGPDLESSLSTLLSELAQQPGGGENDDGMLNVISGIVRQVFAAMAGSGNGGQTISSFLESMPDYSYSRGEGVITDLLMTLAGSLTFGDLVGFLGGSNAVIGRLRAPLRDFLLQRVMLLDRSCSTPPESSETEEAVLRLLDDSFPSLAAAVQTANVVEDVDFSETCFRFLSLRLTELAMYIWQTPDDEFSAGFYDVCQKFMADLTNLCLHCFCDGQASLERMLRNHLSSVSDDVASSSISSWTMSTAIGHFRTYIASLSQPADPSAIECDVVKTQQSESMGLARKKRQENRKEGKTELSVDTADDETFETPRTSPEVMETGEIGQDGCGEAEPIEDQAHNAEVDRPPPAAVEAAFPESLLPRSGMGSGTVLEKEPWHAQVPSEWVPVIARDIQLQSNVPAPAPYSDAYLSTQSAKRRKLAAGGKLDGNLKKVIEGTLQDAIKVAGVQPTTSKEEASKCLAANCKVEQLVNDHTRGSIKRRLDQDKDYVPDKFANCKQFHEK